MKFKDKYKVLQITFKEAKHWLTKKHYAHRIAPSRFIFGLYEGMTLKGVCCYGLPVSRFFVKSFGKDYKGKVLELKRVIKYDDLEQNLQSWFIAQTFKLLPKPLIIVSYADPNNGHIGYTYQALNFFYTGLGGKTYEFFIDGKQRASRSVHVKFAGAVHKNVLAAGGEIVRLKLKHRYILFLGSKTEKRQMRKALKYEILPYPKGDNIKYDAGPEIYGQTRLF